MSDPSTTNLAFGVASLLLRLTVGGLFTAHGFPKVFTSRQQVESAMKGAGIPPVLTDLTGLLEFFGGPALMVGFLTPLVSGLFAVFMASTTLLQKVKFHKPFKGGYELDVVLLMAALTLFILGAGAISIDALLGV